MKKLLSGKKKQTVGFLVFILAITILPGTSFAEDKKHGSEVIVKKKDGATIKAELLTVKNNEIILMDSFDMTGITLRADEIQKITITKKSSVFKGIGLGLVIGGGSGALLGFASGDDDSGWFRWSAGEKAAMAGLGLGAIGLLTGGILGAIKGIDESVELEGRTPEEMKLIMKKLNSRSRFPQDVPQTFQESIFKQTQKSKEKEQGKIRDKPKNPISFVSTDSQKPSRTKFSRIHLSYRPGYFRSQMGNRNTHLFKEIGFGDTKPAHGIYFLWAYFGTAPATHYPKLVQNSTKTFEDVRLDYSITRKFAVGLGYSSLNHHEIDGYKYIPIYRDKESYYSELYLHENFAGKLYYVQFSWMPVPDTFLKKVSFLLGAGAGLSHSNINYMTSKSSYENNPDKKAFSINAIALIGTAEFIYYFNRYWSMGFGAEYRYAPVKVESFRLVGSYYDLDEFGELIESTMFVNVPSHRANSGGFRFGLTAGFHF
jgi:hypothetical protein